MTKWAYSFRQGEAEGAASMRELLGGKGAGLAEMARLGLPVPPGFTITTEVCTYFYAHGKTLPPDLGEQLDAALAKVGAVAGHGFGDADRAAAGFGAFRRARLDAGHDGHGAEPRPQRRDRRRRWPENAGDARFAFDCYRRFIADVFVVVLGVEHHEFEEVARRPSRSGAASPSTPISTRRTGRRSSRATRIWSRTSTASRFRRTRASSSWGAIGAVFRSWMNPRAITYRKMHNIPADWGTAVNVQAMVFGNMGDSSATGVAFTRNPVHRRAASSTASF